MSLSSSTTSSSSSGSSSTNEAVNFVINIVGQAAQIIAEEQGDEVDSAPRTRKAAINRDREGKYYIYFFKHFGILFCLYFCKYIVDF